MAIVTWEDEEQTIFILNLGVGWNWNIFDAAFDQAFTMIETVQQPVDMIIGSEVDTDPLPAGAPIPHFLRAAQHLPDHVRWVVIVVTTNLTRVTLNVLIQLSAKARSRVVIASSWEKARQFVQQERVRNTPPAKT